MRHAPGRPVRVPSSEESGAPGAEPGPGYGTQQTSVPLPVAPHDDGPGDPPVGEAARVGAGQASGDWARRLPSPKLRTIV